MKMHKGPQGVCQKIRMLDDGPDAALVGNLPQPFQLPRVIREVLKKMEIEMAFAMMGGGPRMPL